MLVPEHTFPSSSPRRRRDVLCHGKGCKGRGEGLSKAGSWLGSWESSGQHSWAPCTSCQGLPLPSAVVWPGLQLQGTADRFVSCVRGRVFMGFVAGELGG